MEQKQTKKEKPAVVAQQETPKKSGNKAIWWILGGCLVLVLIIGLAIGVVAFLSYKKIKREVKENQRKFEDTQKQNENRLYPSGDQTNIVPIQPSIPEEPVPTGSTGDEGVPDDIYPPAASEKAIGYLKKIYTKGGKNYIDIDYIQWLSGDVAEKAMREDGQCPKKGECIVLNDYYIRNQNPLIRTFEVAPEAEILAHDFGSDYTTGKWNQSWDFYQFSQYFNSSANNGYWDYAPFHVEIGNNQIIKITEQYIP